GTKNAPDIKQIFHREEEFDPHNEGTWEEYQSYFPGGVHVPESRDTLALCPDVLADVAQVGDTDVEEQQNIDSEESFPVISVLYLASPKSSDEDIVSIKKKKKKKKRRKCYYR
ncbi:hypothetical protein A6R68_17331, partial [Neotoma lepida]